MFIANNKLGDNSFRLLLMIINMNIVRALVRSIINPINILCVSSVQQQNSKIKFTLFVCFARTDFPVQ